MGKLKDPYGHVWAVATFTTIYTPEEMAEGQAAWLASLGGPPQP